MHRMFIAIALIHFPGVFFVAYHADAGDPKLASSLFSAVIHNHREIREMDVRYKLEYVVVRPDSQLTVRTIQARIVRGAKAQRLSLFARIAESQEMNNNTDDQNEHNVVAYLIGPGKQVKRIDAFGMRLLHFPSHLIRNARIGMPVLETVGFVSFPHLAPMAGADDAYWESLMIPNDECVAYASNDGQAKVVQKHFHNNESTGETIWIFDLKKLMPTQRKMLYRTSTGKLKLKEIENYEWRMLNGVHVPATIRCEIKQNTRNEITGELLGYSEIYTTEFDWESVNESIPDEVYNLESLKTANDIKAIILAD